MGMGLKHATRLWCSYVTKNLTAVSIQSQMIKSTDKAFYRNANGRFVYYLDWHVYIQNNNFLLLTSISMVIEAFFSSGFGGGGRSFLCDL